MSQWFYFETVSVIYKILNKIDWTYYAFVKEKKILTTIASFSSDWNCTITLIKSIQK